jgi:hypothetical protein
MMNWKPAFLEVPLTTIAASVLFVLLTGVPAQTMAQNFAEPNPPVLPVQEEVGAPVAEVQAPSAAPSMEWTMHRSVDGSVPSDAEQRMMFLMNRARQDPTAEGIWLAESNDPDIANGRDFFNVDINALKSALAAIDPAAPAAFDFRLWDASRLHSEDLIARDAQDHDGQVEKVQASGFSCNGGRFSVFSYADSALNAHAALNIDWGNGPDGMQDPPGHRFAIMSVFTSPLDNVGLAIVPEDNPGTQVGDLVFSGAYCHAGGSDENRFIVGTVYEDNNGNGEYDEGEGLDDVTVMPDSGTYFAVTGNAGGYAIPITSPGTYRVTFSGGELGQANYSQTVEVGAESVLLDLEPSMVVPDYVASFVMPNLAGGAEMEAVMITDSGIGHASVADLGSAASVNSFDFSSNLAPTDAKPTTDFNNNGSDDIAFLGHDAAALKPRVEIRDPLTGSRLKNIDYNGNHVPVAFDTTFDHNGNQSEEGVVLAKHTTNNDRGRLLIRDLVTKAKVNNVSLPKIFDVRALVMGPDISGNGAADALVLATRISDGKIFVLVWDTGGDGKIVNIQLPKNHSPVGHDYLTGPGGVAAATVMALRETDNQGRVFVYDALTATKLWAATVASGRQPVAIKAFQSAGGGWRVAVLVHRTSDNRPIVSIYNANTGAIVDNVFFVTGQTPLDLTIIPDTGLDGNNNPELGVVVDNGALEMKVRDSVSKTLLQTVGVN